MEEAEQKGGLCSFHQSVILCKVSGGPGPCLPGFGVFPPMVPQSSGRVLPGAQVVCLCPRAEVKIGQWLIILFPFSLWPFMTGTFLTLEKREQIKRTRFPELAFSQISRNYRNGEITWSVYFFSISETGKQVICEISLDFGNLERIQFSCLNLLLTFLLKRDLLTLSHCER